MRSFFSLQTQVVILVALFFWGTSEGVLHAFGQNVMPVEVKVIGIEPRAPFFMESRVYMDKKILFRLTNTSNKMLTLYGSLIEGVIYPRSYGLDFDKKLGDYRYPTRDNKPLKWKRESKIYKKTMTLKPGEAFEFDSNLSSRSDCGKRSKIAIYVSFGKSKKIKEIRSEEFTVGECKPK